MAGKKGTPFSWLRPTRTTVLQSTRRRLALQSSSHKEVFCAPRDPEQVPAHNPATPAHQAATMQPQHTQQVVNSPAEVSSAKRTPLLVVGHTTHSQAPPCVNQATPLGPQQGTPHVTVTHTQRQTWCQDRREQRVKYTHMTCYAVSRRLHPRIPAAWGVPHTAVQMHSAAASRSHCPPTTAATKLCAVSSAQTVGFSVDCTTNGTHCKHIHKHAPNPPTIRHAVTCQRDYVPVQACIHVSAPQPI